MPVAETSRDVIPISHNWMGNGSFQDPGSLYTVAFPCESLASSLPVVSDFLNWTGMLHNEFLTLSAHFRFVSQLGLFTVPLRISGASLYPSVENQELLEKLLPAATNAQPQLRDLLAICLLCPQNRILCVVDVVPWSGC